MSQSAQPPDHRRTQRLGRTSALPESGLYVATSVQETDKRTASHPATHCSYPGWAPHSHPFSSTSTSLPPRQGETSNAAADHSHPSMIGQPPMYYDPNQVDPNANSVYDHWEQFQSRGQLGYAAGTLQNTIDVNQGSYQAQAPTPAQAGSQSGAMQQMSNEFPYGADQYGQSAGMVAPSYPQQFVQGHSGQQQQQQQQAMANVVPAQYPPSQHSRQFQQSNLGQGAYQRQQQQYVQQPHHPPNEIVYFQQTGSESASQPVQSYQFTFNYGSGEHLSTPSTQYTPSPDQHQVASSHPSSSMSPLSWVGTDDNQSHNPSTTRVSPRPAASASTGSAQQKKAAGPSASQLSVSAVAAGKRPRRPAKAAQKPDKRRKQDAVSDSETASDDEEGEGGQGHPTVPPLKGPSSAHTRLPGACRYCKKLKMKCDFPPNENTCKRCKQSGHPCIVDGRRPRNAPNKREYLLAQIRQKDLVIESLLKQLHDPYLATPLSIDSFKQATSPSDRNKQNVMEWLERMQASVKNAGTSAGIKAFKLDSRTLNSNSNALDGGDESDEESNRDVTERGTVVGHGEGGVGASGSGVGGGGGGGGGGEEDGEKLYTLPEDTVPFGLLARLSLANQKKKAREEREKDKIDETDDNDVGVANDAYFAPGPSYDLNIRANMIEQHSLPEIIVHGLVTADDVNKLFEIFYARLNSHVSLLDPVLHDAKSTFTRCPFLFTVICAISSRFYEEKSEIYPIAMHFAKHAAANALISGWKSVELAQAYLLLSIYGVPAKRWEDDRSWLYIGLAIRLATDLNLQHVPTTKPATERQEREILNRTRTWINLYNLDRSLSTQYGKPYSIKEDYIIRTSNNWYNKSKYNHPLDVSLCGYNALLQIVSRFHEEVYSDPDNPSGLNMRLDFRRLAGEYDERLNAYETEWRRRYEEGTDLNDRACALRLTLLPFVTFYARLVMYSFAFQHALRRGLQPEDKPVIDKCYEYAMGVVNGMVNELAPTGYMRYSPDGYFVFATFASGFLLKLLRREFTLFISIEQQDQIFDSIGTLIYTLNTPEIAMDDRHTPRLHARFLASLLSRHRRNVAPATATQQQNPPQGQVHGGTPGQHSSASGSSSHSSGSSQVYSSTSTQGSMQGQHGMGTTHSSPQAEPPMDTAAIESNFLFGGSVVDTSELGSALSATYTDDMLPGALQFFKNEAYWQNALMPGFPWPETRGYDAMQTAHGFASGFVAQPVPAATYS